MRNKNGIKKSSIILVLAFCFIMLSSMITEGFAYTTDNFNVSPNLFNNAVVTQLADSLKCTHESGRLLVVETGYNFAATCTLLLRVYSIGGAFEGNFSFGYNLGANWINGLTVAVQNYDSDECLIWSLSRYAAATYKWRMRVIKVNVITGASVTYDGDVNDGSANYRPSTIQCFTYSSMQYAVLETYCDGASNNFIRVCRFTGSAVSFLGGLDTGWENADPTGVRCFQSNDTSIVWIIADSGAGAGNTQPALYKCDLTSGTITLHITCGTAGIIPSGLAERTHYHLIDGGVAEDSGQYYVYATWSFSDVAASVRRVRLFQWRVQYSDATLAPAVIVAQNLRYGTIFPNYGVETVASWSTGLSIDRTQFKEYLANYLSSTNIVSEGIYEITDFFNMGISSISQTSWTANSTEPFPYNSEETSIHREWGSTFQVNVDLIPVPDKMYVYGGLAPLETNYDITLTYTPNDNPLIVNKPYVFSGVVTNNGVGTQVIKKIVIDGIQYSFSSTNPSGAFSFSLTLGTSGVHTITVEVYTSGIYRYGEDFTYSFVDAGAGSFDYGGNLYSTINMVLGYLPMVGVIVVPSLLTFAESKSIYLSLFVMVIVIGFLTALAFLPFYMLFFAVFGFVGYVIVARRSGGE